MEVYAIPELIMLVVFLSAVALWAILTLFKNKDN